VDKRFTLAAFILVALAPARADDAKSYPARILIIRHGEKPSDAEMVGLSEEGKERAKALHKLFEKSDERPDPFPRPDFIFATKDSKKSHRPRLTVTPLAKKLELKIDDRFANADFAKLANELLSESKYAGKTVLVGWHHGIIPQLAAKLGAKDAPDTWKDAVFDRVWQLDYDDKGKVTFQNLPQHLMPGDSKK
jgi:hypothetical protein